jgi:hypothetical protein
MATAALASGVDSRASRAQPRALILSVGVVAALAAGGASFALALTSDHVAEPGLQAALMNWMICRTHWADCLPGGGDRTAASAC